MNTPALPRRTRKSGLVLLIVSLALGWWVVRQSHLRALGSAVAHARSEQTQCEGRIAEATAQLGAGREQLRRVKAQSREFEARVARLQREWAAADPDSLWAAPPSSPLEWDPNSPYIWLLKDRLPALPVAVFSAAGEMLPQIAQVFCLDTAAQQALNANLKELLAGYHALEAARAELTDEHLPGYSDASKKVTVRIPPLAGEEAPLKARFADILREALGEQRSRLVLDRTDGWFDSRNNQLAGTPKVLSASRTRDGRYSISIKCGSNWLSTSGFNQLEDHVPPHLLPLFHELTEPK